MERSKQVRRPFGRSSWRNVGTFGLVVLSSSCGGTSTATTTPAQGGGTVPPAVSSSSKPTVELQSAPSGVFLVGRVKQTRQLVSRVAEWCSLPFDLDDALAAMGDEFPKLVRFDLPIDFAVSLADESEVNQEPTYPSEPEWTDGGLVYDSYEEPSAVNTIVSVAVEQPEVLVSALRGNGTTVEARDTGEYVIQFERDLWCTLGPALGPTPHRLACGPSLRDLETLAGYARSGLVVSEMPDKAGYAELRFAPLAARYGSDTRKLRAELPELLREANIGNERFDRALDEAAHAVVEEIIAWVDGVDVWSFSMDFLPSRDVLVGESSIRFKKDDSYLAGAMRRSAAVVGPAPQMFWELPSDVTVASFSRRPPLNEADEKIAANLSELLAGGLEHLGVASGVLDNWVKSFRGVLDAGGTTVVAMGSLPPPKTSKKVSPQGLLDAFGYYLIGIEGDHGAYAHALRSTVVTFNDKRFRAELTKKLGSELPKLPKIRSRTLPKSKTSPAVELFDMTFTFPKSELTSTYRMNSLSVHLAMTTVGERTWLGVGFSEAAALDKVRLMVQGGEYPKLAARGGLAALHEQNMLDGSFLTLGMYARLFAGLPAGSGKQPMGDGLLRAMPHRGETPVVFQIGASAEGPTMTVRAEFPREVFEDGSALTMAVVAAFTSAISDAVEPEGAD